MKKCSLTDIGMRREMNQDYFYSSEEPVGSLPNLFVVADGMGGHNAGEFASRYAVETMVNTAKNTEKTDTIGILTECVSNANASLWAYAGAHDEMRGMGTTLVAAWIGADGLRWVSVGDSLQLLIREEKMFLLNELHQYSAELERMADEGIISREEALSHPARHSLTSALMGKEVPLVDLREECFPLFPGDRVLVASDGVGPYLDSLGPAGMRYLSMLSAEELVRSVLDGINRDGAPNQDNATLICAEIARACSALVQQGGNLRTGDF